MSTHPNVVSFGRLVDEWLPAEIGKIVSLTDYRAECLEEGRYTVEMSVSTAEGEVTVRYELPAPRGDGSFIVDGREVAVCMVADRSNLEAAQVKCVGEQIADEIRPRLVAPPEGVELTAEFLKAWLPLEKWITEFLLNSPTSEETQYDNWLARQAYLRRIVLPEDDAGVHPSQMGRACPFETPEGPNCGRILHLAVGAEVRDGRIVVRDERPEAALGLTASMVPLLEHNDGARQLSGVNMMRQWLDLGEPEPALVQTGNEPEDETFWAGRNLLTAFIHWKGLTCEDGIVVSESRAAKLASPQPLEVGDKLSNRHGTKGVVAAILPDGEMPHLPDGRPVELIFDFIGVHARLNFGQILEAMLGNVAHATGEAVIAPPFEGPTAEEVREMLVRTGLAEDGQMQLADGKGGAPLAQPSTVGYVYWGKTYHRASTKLSPWFEGTASGGSRLIGGCRAGELESYALRSREAYETIIETYCTKSMDRPGVEDLFRRLTEGPVAQSGAPSPAFERLRALLWAAGISMQLAGSTVSFAFAEASPDDIALAVAVPHPWCPERQLTHMGRLEDEDQGEPVKADRLAAQSLSEGASKEAAEEIARQLAQSVQEALESLPIAEALRPGNRVAFSARSVLAPGPDLALGQIGLPEEMAWGLFEPLVIREVGVEHASSRDGDARAALERIMAENLVLMNRAPTIEPTGITAFRPVLRPGPAIRLHPLCCRIFNADFDGDQAAIHLAVTDAGQREAREKLTLEAHLRRDPGTLVAHLAPSHAILFGLACAARSRSTREQLLQAWPEELPEPPELLTRSWLIDALRRVLDEHGPDVMLDVLERLMHLGIEAATESGASVHAFIGSRLDLPTLPNHRYPAAWHAYAEAVESAVVNQAHRGTPDLGPQVLAVQSGARGTMGQLRQLVGPRGVISHRAFGGPIVTTALRDGVAPSQHLASQARLRESLQTLGIKLTDAAYEVRSAMLPDSDGVIARAMQADHPGKVFAQAALREETDPLSDPVVRLFVGLRPAS